MIQKIAPFTFQASMCELAALRLETLYLVTVTYVTASLKKPDTEHCPSEQPAIGL